MFMFMCPQVKFNNMTALCSKREELVKALWLLGEATTLGATLEACQPGRRAMQLNHQSLNRGALEIEGLEKTKIMNPVHVRFVHLPDIAALAATSVLEQIRTRHQQRRLARGLTAVGGVGVRVVGMPELRRLRSPIEALG